jgi:phosphatidylglycerophosphate synthase
MKQTSVLLYPCNIVGYVRLTMLVAAAAVVALYGAAGWQMGWALRFGIAVWLFFCLLILDLLDGHLARKLGHATKFGALFELTLDLLTHTFVWTLSGLAIAPLLIALEWSVGLYIAAFTMSPNSRWKTILAEQGPWLSRLYWRPMRVNLLNDYSNVGHFVFPMSLFVFGAPMWLGYLALPGLIVYEVTAVYALFVFMKILVDSAD